MSDHHGRSGAAQLAEPSGPIARFRQRPDGVWQFMPTARATRAGFGVAILGRDEEAARAKFEELCKLAAAAAAGDSPVILHKPTQRTPHPADRDPNLMTARPGRDGWTVTKGTEVVATGLAPFQALDMVREAGGFVERRHEDA